jgi:glyoxylase-like metal-dependent hydrolase (beta-lactamase superfamily II)
MKLLVNNTHSLNSTNCYVVGSDFEVDPPGTPRIALIIDPGHSDQEVFDFIEDNEYTLGAVLLTHEHQNHVRGLRTLMKIYQAPVYAMNPIILEYKTLMIRDASVFTVGPFSIETISVPGHALDSLIFRIDRLLFTGDALSAGLVGRTSSAYGARLQANALLSKVFSLPGDYVVLPGHGPPSSLNAERRFNAGIELYEKHKIRRQRFEVDW